MMNRKQAFRCVSFIVILSVLLVMVSYVVRTNGSTKNRFAGFYSEKKNSIDVLYFGSSATSKTFSPGFMWDRYGFTSYPLSSNSQRSKAIQLLLEESYHYQSPEVVVIEPRTFAFSDDTFAEDEAHLREVTDNLRITPRRICFINRFIESDTMDKITFYLDIIKYHSNWKMLLLPSELRKAFYKLNDIDKGFEYDSEVWKVEGDEEWGDTVPVPIDKDQEETLRELLDFLTKNNQKAVFVVTVRNTSDDYPGKMTYIRNIVEEAGFPYINLNEHYSDMGFVHTRDNLDSVHVNILGAEKCCSYIGEYLVDNYNLQDRRNDTGYKSWYEAAESFWNHYNEYSQLIDDFDMSLIE